jgi:glycogen(starch) synthase
VEKAEQLAALSPVWTVAARGALVVLLVQLFGKTEKETVRSSRARPQRVLMLSWEFPPRIVGGIARHVDELARALARGGVSVDILTAFHPGAPPTEVVEEGHTRVRVLRAGPAPIEPLDFVCDIHQLDFALLETGLRGLGLGSVEYDLVHAHDWLVAFAARTLRHGLEVPLVATIHATESGRQGVLHTPMQHYIHSVEWLLTYDAWRVICCSQGMSAEVQGALHVPSDKIDVVPNGVDPRRLECTDTPGELAAFRRRWATEEERIVFFVGRLVREKGVEVLIDALPEVLATHPEVRAVIAGGGSWGDLAARAASRGVGQKVTFAGFVPEEDLPRLYAVSDLAVFPSLYEPFGIVAIEAMAAGVPVVTSDIGGFREVVRHGHTGLHTWANNPHSLAWGMNEVLSNQGLAERLKRNGLRDTQTRFNWDGIAEKTIRVYDEVLRLPTERKRVPVIPMVGPGVRPRYVAGGTLTSRS